MRPRLLLAALACALAVPAPARADEPVYGCGFESVASEDASGGSGYSMLGYGAVAHAGGDVSITCLVRVNGVEQSRTPTGTGTAVAATTGRVYFDATETDFVEGCAVATVDGHEHRRCLTSRNIQIPPQEVLDPIEEALYAADEVVCPFLGGDVDVAGEPFWDCPPYGI